MWPEFFDKVGAGDAMAFLFTGFLVLCSGIVAIVAIVAWNWRKVRLAQLDVAFKRECLERGLSADDVARLVGAKPAAPANATPYPSPSDVVAEQDGDWYAALLLKTDGERYLVHYKGYDEEEWVTLDRLRFPAAVEQANAASACQAAHPG
jgi:hypothetical protein